MAVDSAAERHSALHSDRFGIPLPDGAILGVDRYTLSGLFGSGTNAIFYEPPYTEEPMTEMGDMHNRWKWRWGQTVYKSGGTWTVGHTFDHDTLAAADSLPDASESSYEGKYVWIGGHKFDVTADIQTEIEAANVGGTFT